MSEEQKRLLEKQLWAVANILRGKMNADEYRNYILGFIFYKYLSEKLEKFINEKLLVREDFVFSEIEEDTKKGKTILEEIKKATVSHLGFFLKPTDLFGYLVKKGNGEIKGENTFILENLKNVLNTIEQTSMGTASEDDFKGLFDDVVLTSPKLGKSEQKKNEVIVEVLMKLSEIDFKLEDSKSDLLGDAYEYLIGEFAAGAGKKGGEFYTPAQVSRLLAQIVTEGKKRLKSVYDPTCGSGSLLLRIGDYANVSMYYGQELNPTTYNLARMNMILHGVPFDSFSIRQGDTLVDDMHLDLQAEAVVANPPFSAKWKGDTDPILAADERFTQYGRLAPKGAADYAFVTHMLHHLADNGVMAVVLPHGALFRSGAENQIRKYIISNLNYLDTVIGLPVNLFYGTGIPATILVFKKCRANDNILFIDASNEYEDTTNQNRLTDENINKIFQTYQERTPIKKYSYLASIEDIKKNDFNLNIPRYVDTFQEQEKIELTNVVDKMTSLKRDEQSLIAKLDKFCKQLSIPLPDSNNIPLLLSYKNGIFQQVFSQELRFLKDNGKPFEDWKKVRLGNIFKERKEKNGKQDFQLLSVSLNHGVTRQSNNGKKDSSNSDKSKYKVVRIGDIAYNTMRMWQGASGVSKYEGIVSPAYTVVYTINGDPFFYAYLFKHPRVVFNFYRYSQGLTSDTWNLKFNHFSEIFVTIPSNVEEQNKIASLFLLIDELIAIKEQQIEQK